MLRINFMRTSGEIALRWVPRNTFDDKSALVQVMAWCHQATSHYLGQCWPKLCHHMVSLGHNELICYFVDKMSTLQLVEGLLNWLETLYPAISAKVSYPTVFHHKICMFKLSNFWIPPLSMCMTWVMLDWMAQVSLDDYKSHSYVTFLWLNEIGRIVSWCHCWCHYHHVIGILNHIIARKIYFQ